MIVERFKEEEKEAKKKKAVNIDVLESYLKRITEAFYCEEINKNSFMMISIFTGVIDEKIKALNTHINNAIRDYVNALKDLKEYLENKIEEMKNSDESV